MTIVHRSTQKSIQEAKHAVVLDVDNTLTPPRQPLEAEMASALRRLTIPFFLGAGGDLRLVFEQFIEPLHNFGYRGSFDAFLCNGSTRYHCELFEKPCAKLLRGFEMRQHLGENRFLRLMEVIEALLNEGFQHVWYVGDALFEDGNDASVLKFIEQWRGAGRCPVEAIPVESWRDTISVLNNLGIVNGNASLGAGSTVLK